MDWLLVAPSSLLVVLLLVLLLLTTILFLLRAIGPTGPGNPVLSRATFECPVSRRRVTVEFLVPPESDRPADVLSCSVFSKPYHVRCAKRCLTQAEMGRLTTSLEPRYPLGEVDSGGTGFTGPNSNLDAAHQARTSRAV
jgi:hypothetical protein